MVLGSLPIVLDNKLVTISSRHNIAHVRRVRWIPASMHALVLAEMAQRDRGSAGDIHGQNITPPRRLAVSSSDAIALVPSDAVDTRTASCVLVDLNTVE